jgi:hypothetical protein
MKKTGAGILTTLSLAVVGSVGAVTVENYNRAQTDVNFAGVVKNVRTVAVSAANWSTKKCPPGSDLSVTWAQRLCHSAGISSRRAMTPAEP